MSSRGRWWTEVSKADSMAFGGFTVTVLRSTEDVICAVPEMTASS